MKKITSLLLVLVMVLGVFALVGCSNDGDPAVTTAATTEATTDDESKGGELKLGLGLKISASATDASAEANGAGQVTVTAAAVMSSLPEPFLSSVSSVVEGALTYTAAPNLTFASSALAHPTKTAGITISRQRASAKNFFIKVSLKILIIM